jgi:hypothetical protein
MSTFPENGAVSTRRTRWARRTCSTADFSGSPTIVLDFVTLDRSGNHEILR